VIVPDGRPGFSLPYLAARGIPGLGIEPAANVAEVAMQEGIPTVVKFFGEQTARALAAEGQQADLLLGNNVRAHVPDINDFVKGMKILLKPQGVITREFPHLMRLTKGNRFDTIYHEHFSYLSLFTVRRIFDARGWRLFDVEELSPHGGSCGFRPVIVKIHRSRSVTGSCTCERKRKRLV
jgi:hypothetical protein